MVTESGDIAEIFFDPAPRPLLVEVPATAAAVEKEEEEGPLLIIEAMKVESRVPAPVNGKVVAILVAEGEDVKTDETVIQLE